MGLIGSLFGGAVGFAIGGPIGAIAGAAIGHGLSARGERQLDAHERAQASYFISVFSMLAKMARADGVVTQHEIDVVQRFMRDEFTLDSDAERAAVEVFRAAKDSPVGFSEFAQQFHDTFSNDPEVLHSMLDLLVRVAMADGQLHPGEEQLLAEAAAIFGIDAQQAQFIFAQHGAHGGARQSRSGSRATPPPPPTSSAPYDVLGIEPGASDADVKSRYRKLVTEFHPDKIIAKGLPDEFVKFAEQRFREIQEAYETIRAQRGMK